MVLYEPIQVPHETVTRDETSPGLALGQYLDSCRGAVLSIVTLNVVSKHFYTTDVCEV